MSFDDKRNELIKYINSEIIQVIINDFMNSSVWVVRLKLESAIQMGNDVFGCPFGGIKFRICVKKLWKVFPYIWNAFHHAERMWAAILQKSVCVCVLIVIQYMYDTLVMSLSIHWDMGNASFPFRIAGHSVPIQLINKLGWINERKINKTNPHTHTHNTQQHRKTQTNKQTPRWRRKQKPKMLGIGFCWKCNG